MLLKRKGGQLLKQNKNELSNFYYTEDLKSVIFHTGDIVRIS